MNMCLRLFFLLLLSTHVLHARTKALDSILHTLDATIGQKEVYVRQKEQHIAGVKSTLTLATLSDEQRYQTHLQLYLAYRAYQPDTARVYAEKNLHLAKTLNRVEWEIESITLLSKIYAVEGLYIEADQLLKSTSTHNFTKAQQILYYDAYKHLYYFYSDNQESSKKYDAYRNRLLGLYPTESREYKLILAEMESHGGRTESARQILLPLFAACREETHERAMIAFAIAETYRRDSLTEQALYYYAVSAIADIKNAIKENASLRYVATTLYATNDIERAYRYIQESMEDAIFSNARLRTFEVSSVFPIIEKAHKQQKQQQQNRLVVLLCCIGLLSLFLIAAIVYVNIQLRHLRIVRKSLSETNQKLNGLNDALQQNNERMALVNNELKAANHLKENYICEFLNICSLYINKLEKYQNRLNKLAMESKMEQLCKLLKSREMIENEAKELYEMFDPIFTNLYPTFVEEFNALLLPEQRFELKNGSQLIPELRIFALIRLGVHDSGKIATFLRYSTTTIYNYRTRVKNRSAIPRDEFEMRVMQIGLIR